jgi:GNAT superfamily N-acetyltransferase
VAWLTGAALDGEDRVVPVHELDRTDRRAVRRFVRLERELNTAHPLHWADVDRDVVKRLRGRSPTGEVLELQLLVAGDGRPRARCAAIVNRRWQEDNAHLAGGVGYLAAADGAGAEVAEMFERAEGWLVAHGCDRAIAPFNGGALQGLGLLTAAYDESPMCPLPWQPPYYTGYLEASGYRPRYPLWIYEIDFAGEAYRKAARRALADPGCSVRTIDKSSWKQELQLMGELVNQGFGDEWEFYDYSREEWAELWGPLKPVFDPRWTLFAEVDGEPAGVCLAFLDWTPLLRRAQGGSGPLAVLRFLRHAKRASRAGVLAISVLPKWRGKGIGQTLLASMYAGFEELGYDHGLYYYVNDANTKSRRLAESFGGKGRVLYHCYEKPLTRT